MTGRACQMIVAAHRVAPEPEILIAVDDPAAEVPRQLRTDTGLEGIGEADSSPEVVKAIIDAPFSHNIACGLRLLLVGENPLDHERLWQMMYRRTMYFGRKAVGILHNGSLYRLQATKLGKLILTK